MALRDSPHRHEKPRGTPKTGGKVPPERLRTVRALLAQCLSNHQIEWALSEKFNVTRHCIRDYIHRVEREMAEESAAMQDTLRERMREANLALYQACVKDKKFSAAGQCLERLARIGGCYVDKLEVSGPAGGPMPFEVKAEIDLSDWSPEKVQLLKEALLGTGK